MSKYGFVLGNIGTSTNQVTGFNETLCLGYRHRHSMVGTGSD